MPTGRGTSHTIGVYRDVFVLRGIVFCFDVERLTSLYKEIKCTLIALESPSKNYF